MPCRRCPVCRKPSGITCRWVTCCLISSCRTARRSTIRGCWIWTKASLRLRSAGRRFVQAGIVRKSSRPGDRHETDRRPTGRNRLYRAPGARRWRYVDGPAEGGRRDMDGRQLRRRGRKRVRGGAEGAAEGGTAKAIGDTCSWNAADSVTLSWPPRRRSAFRTRWRKRRRERRLPSDRLYGAASASYRRSPRLFRRVTLSLGTARRGNRAIEPGAANGTAARRGSDPGCSRSIIQYGRYLLIASSRPGTLPANLQGIWNDISCRPGAASTRSTSIRR